METMPSLLYFHRFYDCKILLDPQICNIFSLCDTTENTFEIYYKHSNPIASQILCHYIFILEYFSHWQCMSFYIQHLTKTSRMPSLPFFLSYLNLISSFMLVNTEVSMSICVNFIDGRKVECRSNINWVRQYIAF